MVAEDSTGAFSEDGTEYPGGVHDHSPQQFAPPPAGAQWGNFPGAPNMIVVGTQENATPGAWLDLLQEVCNPLSHFLSFSIYVSIRWH